MMKILIYRKRFSGIPKTDNYTGRKRRGRYDTYTIELNEKGWYVRFLAINGQCNKRGEHYLFKNLNQDSINYPEALGDYMEFLWEHSKKRNEKWIQQKLNVIAKWIRDVERTSPESKFWRLLK